MPPDANNFARYPSLNGRVVLITGGASGIGESMVEAFARQNSKVAFLDLQKSAAETLIGRITEAGYPAPLFLECDLTNTAAAQSAVACVEKALGDVDVLVNNAGNDTRHAVEEVTPELWDQLIAVNVKQQFFMCQSVIPGMRRLGRGSIINLSSIAWAIPSTNVPPVCHLESCDCGLDPHPGTRARTTQHSRQLRDARMHLDRTPRRLWFTDEYKAQMLERQALKRLLQPHEIANLILFLAADDSSAITNQSHVADGGWV